MKTVVINQQQVYELLPMNECIGAMEAVLMGLARGECTLPLRQIMWLAKKTGAMGLMPAYWSVAGVIGLKAVTFFPSNEGTELDTHQGAVSGAATKALGNNSSSDRGTSVRIT